MSVKATTRRGKPVWAIQVLRADGAYNRRRYLDRRMHLKQDALAVEAELIAERSDYRNRVMNLRLHILPQLGDLPLDQVTRMEVDALGARLRAGVGEPASSQRTRERAGRGARRPSTTSSPPSGRSSAWRTSTSSSPGSRGSR